MSGMVFDFSIVSFSVTGIGAVLFFLLAMVKYGARKLSNKSIRDDLIGHIILFVALVLIIVTILGFVSSL
jgi:hypothetical protein